MMVVTHEMNFARNVGSRTRLHGSRRDRRGGAGRAQFFAAPKTERAQRFLQQFED